VVGRGVLERVEAHVSPLADAVAGKASWRKLSFRGRRHRRGLLGDDIYMLSHKDAPRFKILKVSLSNPDLAARQDDRAVRARWC